MPLTVVTTDAFGEKFSSDSFLRYVSLENDRWWDGEKQDFLFRGHAQADWRLLPSALRHPPNDGPSKLIDFFARSQNTRILFENLI